MKKHKIIFIVPYFGKLPSYFDVWLLSVSFNPDIDFLLITDAESDKKFPPNVKVMKWSFDELKKYIQKCFDFMVNIKTPYHLVDYKPAYGFIFNEYIQGYDFWGHCDLDQVFGDIRSFMREDILHQYEVIQYLGHFLLYANHAKVNTLFMNQGGLYSYKTVLSTDEYYSFTETTGLLQIILKNDIRHYNRPCFADIQVAHKKYLMYQYGDNQNYTQQVFYWEEGKIYQAYIEKGEVQRKEFMYLHFQKKAPVIEMLDLDKVKSFYCFYDKFVKKAKGLPKREDIYQYSNDKGVIFIKYEKFIYILKKLRQFRQCSAGQKRVWLNQKLSKKRLLSAKITEI